MKSVASKNPDQSVPLRQGGWCAPLVSLFVGQTGPAEPGRVQPGPARSVCVARGDEKFVCQILTIVCCSSG